jgi:hypothetical protein
MTNKYKIIIETVEGMRHIARARQRQQNRVMDQLII